MTHLLALIFLALCAVVILMATPHEDRGTALNVIVGTLVALLVFSWIWPFILFGAYWVWTTLTPWGIVVSVCSIVLIVGYRGRRSKSTPTANPATPKTKEEERRIDPMTCDGIIFRGKRLSTREYMALPASEKARWQEEVGA